MVSQQSIQRYRNEISRIGLQEAVRIASLPPNQWREIKNGLGITTNKKSSVLAQQRILRRVLTEIQQEQPNQDIFDMATSIWGDEVKRLREENEELQEKLQESEKRLQLTQKIVPILIEINLLESKLEETLTKVDLTNLNSDELQALLEELEERLKELKESEESEEETEEEKAENDEKAIQALPKFIDRNLSYTKTAKDKTVIYHFIRELTLYTEITKEELIEYSRGFAAYIHKDANQNLKNKRYFKFFINLVNELGVGVSASMSNGFIPAKQLTVQEIQELIIEAAEKLTSGTNILVITFNITSI